MSAHSPPFDSRQLMQLSEEVSRIAATLGELAHSSKPTAKSDGEAFAEPPRVSLEHVAWLIKARRKRGHYLSPELFCDPAWDILLDLLQAELTGQRVSVSSACIAAGVPPTTGLRYIRAMVEDGIIFRRPDRQDGRRVFLELSPATTHALRCYFAEIFSGSRLA